MRVPVEGEAGVGYVMRAGFHLPPLMFTAEEVEAIAVGLILLARTRDGGLQQAASRVRLKLAEVLPPHITPIEGVPLRASTWSDVAPPEVDCGLIREAIRHERKLRFTYQDAASCRTTRRSATTDADLLARRDCFGSLVLNCAAVTVTSGSIA